MAPVTISASRWKSALLFLGSTVFVLVLTQMLLAGELDLILYPGLAMFGLGMLISAAHMVRPPRLILTDQGFTCRALTRTWSVRWEDIEELFLWENPVTRWPATQKLVAWTYRPGREPKKAMARVSAALGASGALPGMWTLGSAQLLELMQARHRKNFRPGVGPPLGPASSGHEPEREETVT